MKVPNVVLVCLFYCGVAVTMATQVEPAVEGQLIFDTISSPALAENRVGDPAERKVAVYLPPGYDTDPDRRYPVVYITYGMGGATDRMAGDLKPVLDRLLAQGVIRDMIVVMVGAGPVVRSGYVFSFYTDSPVLGGYEAFLTGDLIGHVDHHYRTLPQAVHRGINGVSLGGYGAIYLAMKHPDLFGAVYAQDASALDFETYWEGKNIGRVLEIDASGDLNRLQQAGIEPKALFSAAAAFSPNVDRPPFFVDWPWEEREGAIVRVDSVWTRWKQFDPVAMIPALRDRLSQREGLPSGLVVQFDAGTGERTNIADARAFDRALTAAGISHLFEEFEGGHTDSLLARFESRVMPFFSRALTDSL